MKTSRFGIGGLVFACAVVSACSSVGDPDSAGGRLGATVASSLTAADTAFFVAADRGFFGDHRLEIDEIPVNGTAPALAGLSNGSIHIVDASPFVVAKANQDGMDLRYFCGNLNVNWPGYLGRADTDLPSAGEVGFEAAVGSLRGKTIGVGARGGGIEAISDSILGKAGVASADVEYVAVGFGAGAIAQLELGNVDVLLTYPYLTQQAGDRGTLLVDVPSHAPEPLRNAMNAGWVAPRTWLDANPEAAEAFCTALGDAVEFAGSDSNAEHISRIVGERFGLESVDVQTELVGAGKPLSMLTTRLDCASMEYALEIGLEQNQFAAEPSQGCHNLIWNGPDVK